MSIRVLLVDDNNLFRKGLAALISAHPDFTVVGDVSTCVTTRVNFESSTRPI